MTDKQTIADTHQEDSLLSFSVGPYFFCVPAVDVASIITPPTIHSIPLSPNSIAGMFPHRGDVAVVVSLRSKFGLPDHQDMASGQLILSNLGSGLKAFWVDEVLETSATEHMEWRPASQIMRCECFEQFALRESEVFLYTTFERLFAASDSELAALLKQVASDNQSSESGVAEDASDNDNKKSLDSLLAGDGVDEARLETTGSNEASIEQENKAASKATGSPGTSANTVHAGKHYQQTRPLRSSGTNDNAPAGTRATRASAGFSKPGTGSYQTKRTVKPASPYSGHHVSQQENRYNSNKAAPTYNSSYQRSTADNYSFSSQSSRQDTIEQAGSNNSAVYLFMLAILVAIPLLLWWLWPEKNTNNAPRDTVIDSRIEPDSIYAVKETVYPTKTFSTDSLSVNSDSAQTPDPEYLTTKDAEPEGLTIKPDTGTGYMQQQASEINQAQEDTTYPDARSGRIYQLESENFSISVERPGNDAVSSKQGESESRAEENESSAGPKAEETIALPSYEEFTHVVVKGDTLWHIAIRYLGNPYYYPKLAKLSLIKNPDLIYPGDVVRITRKIPIPG